MIGAAAFNGSTKLLKDLLKNAQENDINFSATEKKDHEVSISFNQEYTGYTPAMLAIANGGQNTECLRLLHKANAVLTTVDPVGNNLFHIAVRNKNHPALEFLLENWP